MILSPNKYCQKYRCDCYKVKWNILIYNQIRINFVTFLLINRVFWTCEWLWLLDFSSESYICDFFSQLDLDLTPSVLLYYVSILFRLPYNNTWEFLLHVELMNSSTLQVINTYALQVLAQDSQKAHSESSGLYRLSGTNNYKKCFCWKKKEKIIVNL